MFKDYTPYTVTIKHWHIPALYRAAHQPFVRRTHLKLCPLARPSPSVSPLVTPSLFSVSALLHSRVLLFRFHKVLFNLKILQYCTVFRTLQNKVTSRGQQCIRIPRGWCWNLKLNSIFWTKTQPGPWGLGINGLGKLRTNNVVNFLSKLNYLSESL